LRFAKSFRASIVLLYVAEINPAGSELGARHLDQLESDLRRIGRKELLHLRKSEIPASIPSQSLIRAGQADAEIVETARDVKADLIVMATHSHGSPHGQLGSICERVARCAHCPVLLVPPKETCVPFFL
jgi:nucleotide-binding universal stress UspA family protein